MLKTKWDGNIFDNKRPFSMFVNTLNRIRIVDPASNIIKLYPTNVNRYNYS